MQPERKELVLLRSVGGGSRRYRRENLALLQPQAGAAAYTTYRGRWVHPSLRPGEAGEAAPELAGRTVRIHFFEYGAGLLVPVRLARVADAAWSAGALRLGLVLEGWLDPHAAPDPDLIPRLGAEPPEPGAPLPGDGLGPHAFVFPRPPGWATASAPDTDEEAAWRAAVAAVTAPPASPYRDCRFLAGFPPAEGRGPWRVSLLSGPDAAPGPGAARLVALQAGRRVGAAESTLTPGVAARLSLDVSSARPGGAPLEVELHLVGEGAVSAAGRWTQPAPVAPPPGQDGGEASLEAVLAHVSPENGEQRALLRQLVRGVRRHAGVQPWLAGLLLGWGMARDAAELLSGHPGLADRVSDLELAAWFPRLRREGLAECLEAELVRRVRAGGAPFLAEELLAVLDGATDGGFWETLARLGLPLPAPGGGPLLDHPFGAAVFTVDRWEDWLAQLGRRFPAAPPTWKPWVAALLRESPAWADAAADWERQALRRGEGWADAARALRGLPAVEAPPLLARLGRAEAGAASAWYYAARHELSAGDPDLWAEVLYALRRLAPPEEHSCWDAELAEAALASGDALLLARARRRLEAGGADAGALRERLDDALRGAVADGARQALGRLREGLRGRRVLLLGGQYEPGWVEEVREEVGVDLVVRTAERDAAFSAADIPDGVAFCGILRWAGHDAMRVARDRLGPERVRFLNGTGRRAFLSALADMLEDAGHRP